LENARTLKRLYDASIKGLMSQFGVRTEFEVASGFLVTLLQKLIRKTTLFRKICDGCFYAHYRKEFEKEFYDETNKVIPPEAHSRMEAKALCLVSRNLQSV